jgi:hypothetical protein
VTINVLVSAAKSMGLMILAGILLGKNGRKVLDVVHTPETLMTVRQTSLMLCPRRGGLMRLEMTLIGLRPPLDLVMNGRVRP